MRIGYFDCFSGISGDMTLGAWPTPGSIPARPVGRRQPRPAVRADFRDGPPGRLPRQLREGHRPARARASPPAPHRGDDRQEHALPRQNELAGRIFLKLGEAEAAAHGIDIKKVHFHEVGAVDSIVDIVGSAVGLDLLGVERFEASPLPTGRGWVRAARQDVPAAPGTAELLKGSRWPIRTSRWS